MKANVYRNTNQMQRMKWIQQGTSSRNSSTYHSFTRSLKFLKMIFIFDSNPLIKSATMLCFRTSIIYLRNNQQHKNMKYQAVHDRKSVNIVAFLRNYPLICENEEKRQNNVSDEILQNLQAELLGLVKSGKFKHMESTIIWSKHVLYPKGHGRLLPKFRLQGFPEPNQTNAG